MYVTGYAYCNRCGCYLPTARLGEAGSCLDATWCDQAAEHRAAVLAEFAEHQERAAGFAGIETSQTGVPDGYHVIVSDSERERLKRDARRAHLAGDKCEECGKAIERPDGALKHTPARFCLPLSGESKSACYRVHLRANYVRKGRTRMTPDERRQKQKERSRAQKRAASATRAAVRAQSTCEECGKAIVYPANRRHVKRARYCFPSEGKTKSACYLKAHARKRKEGAK